MSRQMLILSLTLWLIILVLLFNNALSTRLELKKPETYEKRESVQSTLEQDDESDLSIIPVEKVQNKRSCSEDFQAGVAILVYGDKSNVEEIALLLDRLTRLGVNSVSINFPIYQDDVWDTEVRKYEWTPDEETLATLVNEAKIRGFTVTIRPLLDEKTLKARQGDWRGTIRPASVKKWFNSYTELVVNYACFAEENEVDILSIGVELSSMEKETEQWNNLISSVKKIYSGQLIYSVNWHNAFNNEIEFWDKLDFIGIDAFFPLDVSEKATVEDLTKAWEPWILKVNDLQNFHEKPVVFTEAGTVSQVGSFRWSWRWDHGVPVDMKAQEIYYTATCKASREVISGIYWWFVDFDSSKRSEEDRGFSPLGKKTEEAIMDCFFGNY